MMTDKIKIISPVDGQVYAERTIASEEQICATLEKAKKAQVKWRQTSVAERKQQVHAFVDAMLAQKERVVEELTWQMGRPIKQGPGELAGFEERSRYMIDIAEQALADIKLAQKNRVYPFYSARTIRCGLCGGALELSLSHFSKCRGASSHGRKYGYS